MFKKFISRPKMLILFLIGVFIVGFVVTYFSLVIFKGFSRGVPAGKENEYSLTPAETLKESDDNSFNVLLLGYGGVNHSGGGLTDSIIVIHLEPDAKKYTMISIPRDLWIQGSRKINAEASVNGYQGALAAVESITGLSIDNYVAIDFGSFINMIDILGGVDVEVPATFTDTLYPIKGEENNTCGKTEEEINALKAQYSDFNLEKQFACRYETVSYQKGPANLDGTAALKFVRSRHGDNDFARSARQFAVLKGISSKLISFEVLGKIDSIIDSIFKIVKTDLSLGKIKALLELFGDPSSYTGNEIHLTNENYLTEGKSSSGGYILYPKAGSYNYSQIKSAISSSINN